jgi:hypothetical protein
MGKDKFARQLGFSNMAAIKAVSERFEDMSIHGIATSGATNGLTDTSKNLVVGALIGKTIKIKRGDAEYVRTIIGNTINTIFFEDLEAPVNATATIGSGEGGEGQIVITRIGDGAGAAGNLDSVVLVHGNTNTGEVHATYADNVLTITVDTNDSGEQQLLAAGNVSTVIEADELDTEFTVSMEFVPGNLPIDGDPIPFTGGSDGVSVETGDAYVVITNDTDALEEEISELAAQAKKHIYNADIGLRNWRMALAKVKASGHGSQENTIINLPILGASGVEGYEVWPTPLGHETDYFSYGFAGLLASKFQDEMGFDDVGRGVIHPALFADSKLWTFTGSTWGTEFSFGIMATCKKWTGTSAGQTATLNFNGTGITYLYAGTGLHSHFTWSIDGGAETDVDQYSSPSNYCKALEITGLDSGNHTLTIKKAAGDNNGLYVIGAYEVKGSKGVRVHRVGKAGATSQDALADNNYMVAEIDYWNAPLYIFALSTNDYISQTAVSTYKTRMQTLITRAKQFGDVLLYAGCPSGEVKTIPQSEYVKALHELAYENDCCFVDGYNYYGGEYEPLYDAGLMTSTAHTGPAGHQDTADLLWEALTY